MKARQAYYFSGTDRDAHFVDDSVPLRINGTGVEYFYAPFLQNSVSTAYGIVYILNGEMFFKSDGKVRTLKKGELSIGGARGIRTYYGSDCDFLHYYWLNFTGYDAENFIKKMGLQPGTSYFVGEKVEFEECFHALFKEFATRDALTMTRMEAATALLLSAFSREIHNKSKTTLASVEYIHKNYNKDIDMEELAAMENFSYPHFFTVFKAFTGVSPSEYITRQRMNSACFYLAGTDYSVAEVATLVGYTDPCYFSRIFKKKIGISPNQYRSYGKK